jgi:hypothetical protein
MKYDSMEPGARAKAARAAVQLLLENDYVSLQEASEALGRSLQGEWDKIMDEASHPARHQLLCSSCKVTENKSLWPINRV